MHPIAFMDKQHGSKCEHPQSDQHLYRGAHPFNAISADLDPHPHKHFGNGQQKLQLRGSVVFEFG